MVCISRKLLGTLHLWLLLFHPVFLLHRREANIRDSCAVRPSDIQPHLSVLVRPRIDDNVDDSGLTINQLQHSTKRRRRIRHRIPACLVRHDRRRLGCHRIPLLVASGSST